MIEETSLNEHSISTVVLTELLCTLKSSGFSVGVDDAIRIAKVFQHSSEWSPERKRFILSTLVVRTEHERLLFEQISEQLFPTPLSKVESQVTREKTKEYENVYRVAFGDEQELDKLKAKKFQWFCYQNLNINKLKHIFGNLNILFYCFFAFVLLSFLFVPLYLLIGYPDSLLQQASKFILTSSVMLIPLYTILLILYLGVWRRKSAYHKLILALQVSKGTRTYRIGDNAYWGSEPLPVKWLSEFTFTIYAPNTKNDSDLVDARSTIHETLRQAGIINFQYKRVNFHSEIVFIEDVSSSMARWPYHATQIVQSLRRQGAQVLHLYMFQTPHELSEHKSMVQGKPISFYASNHRDPLLLLWGDTEKLSYTELSDQDSWMLAVKNGIWIHPRCQSRWNSATKVLATHIRVLSLNYDKTFQDYRFSKSLTTFSEEYWTPPKFISISARSQLKVWRHELGEETFWWLSGGAILAQRASLTTSLWWGMISDGVFSPSSTSIDRVWDIPDLKISKNGSVFFPQGWEEQLIDIFKKENIVLYKRVIKWVLQLIDQHKSAIRKKHNLEQSLALVTAKAIEALIVKDEKLLCHYADKGIANWLWEFASSEEVSILESLKIEKQTFATSLLQGIVFFFFYSWRDLNFLLNQQSPNSERVGFVEKGHNLDLLDKTKVFAEQKNNQAQLHSHPATYREGFDQSKRFGYLKRSIDILCAIVLFMLYSPVFLFIFLAKIASSGSVLRFDSCVRGFFEGEDGRLGLSTFQLCSFDIEEKPLLDPLRAKSGERAAKYNKLLHMIRSHYRKLPHLWNVLVGDMSIVGPDPLTPQDFENLSIAIPFYEEHIRDCKPGLTSLAFVELGRGSSLSEEHRLFKMVEVLTNPFNLSGTMNSESDQKRLEMLFHLVYSVSQTSLWSFLSTEFIILIMTPYRYYLDLYNFFRKR